VRWLCRDLRLLADVYADDLAEDVLEPLPKPPSDKDTDDTGGIALGDFEDI
jgi:hypothetical protein